MPAEMLFTRNETLSSIYQNNASAFRAIANFAEKHNQSSEEIIELLREAADEVEAQAIVVELRDKV